jgi:tRNA U34 5-methylaminomethyl-2-thiouridine-forming methyltransferase MnmC
MENLNRSIATADGSHTLVSDRFGQTYHSVHGALAESRRVFLQLGFEFVTEAKTGISVLEMGFGTGLNALLTWLEADHRRLPVRYVTLEAYPISPEDVAALNYDAVLRTDRLRRLHEAPWGVDVALGEFFTIRKERTTMEAFIASDGSKPYDLIYFDAFSPDTQPELWTAEVFSALARKMPSGGVLTTYSAKGSVRRALQAAGFRVEKHPGPPGKREVVRAVLPAYSGFL